MRWQKVMLPVSLWMQTIRSLVISSYALGKMTDFIKKGDDPNTAWEKAKGQYGRVADAVKIIDPRKE